MPIPVVDDVTVMKRRIATAITVVPYMKIVVRITKLYVMISRKPGNFDCLHMKLQEGNIFSHVCVPVSHSVQSHCTGNTPSTSDIRKLILVLRTC